MVNVDLYSAIITKVSNALDTLVSGEKPGFQTLSKGLVVLLCVEVVQQRVPGHGAVHSGCSDNSSDRIGFVQPGGLISHQIWQDYMAS